MYVSLEGKGKDDLVYQRNGDFETQMEVEGKDVKFEYRSEVNILESNFGQICRCNHLPSH